MLTEARDVLEVLHLGQIPEKQAARLVLRNTDRSGAVRELAEEPRHLDELSRQSGMPVEVVSSTLMDDGAEGHGPAGGRSPVCASL